ncbi:protease complex subunit PrcB family protein [Flavobacterium aestuarii]|uniref:protease complex subunit PrcB family protein n=1 Tax=Flavobacterium aestuarii TaxID=3149227 RepID=UPI0032B42E7C
MKRFILMALAAFGFYSCTDSIDTGDVQNCGNARNVAYESFNYCGQLKENPTKPIYMVINTAEELQQKFNTCTTVQLPDFTQKRIFGILAGPKPSTGYDIKIVSIIEDDCQILVQYSEKMPNATGETPTTTYPADYVVLPKSTKPILFSKVNKVVDYAIVGTYFNECTGADCFKFYRIENYKVLQYPKVTNFPVQFNQTDYKALIFKDDYAGFLSKVPVEIKNIKGQTKTYGAPDNHDQGGVYFEWSVGGVVTKIYLDNDNTTDQTAEVIAFKKVIKDKIAELKTKS